MNKFLILIVLLLLTLSNINGQIFTKKVKYDVIYLSNEFGLTKEPCLCYYFEDDLGVILNSKNEYIEGKETELLEVQKIEKMELKLLLDSLNKKFKMNWLRVGVRTYNDTLRLTGLLVEFQKNRDSVLVYGFCPDSSEYQNAYMIKLRNFSSYYNNRKNKKQRVMKEVEKVKKIKNYLVTVYIRKRVE